MSVWNFVDKWVSVRDTKEPPTNLETYIIGNKNADEILFFIHGFPDNHTLWDKQIQYFKSEYLCITITLPNYNPF